MDKEFKLMSCFSDDGKVTYRECLETLVGFVALMAFAIIASNI